MAKKRRGQTERNVEKRYIEVAGDWELSDHDLVEKIKQNFLNVATAKENQGKIWITRGTGMGKDGKLFTEGSKNLQHTGGRKDFAGYVESSNKVKAAHHKWVDKGKVTKEPPRNLAQTEKLHLIKPRTSVGSIISHAARDYNKQIYQKALSEGLPAKAAEARKNAQGIRILPVTTGKFASEGRSWQEKVDLREAYIKGIGAKQKAFFTRSGTLESKPEQMAREMYDRVAAYVKEQGLVKKTSLTKTRDFFIDAVNAKKFKNPEMAKEFKAGARQFLINKELDIHYKGDSSKPYLTKDALESMKGWHPGSLITSASQTIPNYAQLPGKTETTYTGNTLVNAVTRQEGPDLPENVKLGKGDQAVHVDRMTERYLSSHFAEQLDEQGQVIQKFENPNVEEPVTTWMDELGDEAETTMKKTKTYSTRGGTWSWESPTQATIWKDYPGQIYWSEQVDTGLTPSQWVNTLDVAETPKTALTTNLKAAQQHAYGTQSPHSVTTDALKEFVKPKAEFDVVSGEKIAAVAPSVDTDQHLDRTNLLMQQDMENISEVAKQGFKPGGKTLLTAFDAGKVGQSVDPESPIKPISEIRTQVMEIPGTLSVRVVPDQSEGIFQPTYEERQQMAKFKEDTQANREAWDRQVARKIQEYEDRGRKPYVAPKPVQGQTIAHLGKGDKKSTLINSLAELAAKRKGGDMSNYMGEGDLGIPGATTSNTAPITDADIAPTVSQGIKIISGGQIGADKIGLEEARKLGYQTGGTAPQGFKTSLGVDASLSEFGLSEITTEQINAYKGREKFYGPRTEQNVLNADVTLLFTNQGSENSPGSVLTRNLAAKHKKLLLENPSTEQIKAFKTKHPNIKTINIAGNREFTDRAAIKNALLSMEAKPATKSPEVKIPQFKTGDVVKYTNKEGQSYSMTVSKGEHIHGINIVYHRQPKGWASSEVSTGRRMFTGGTRKDVIAKTQKFLSDPKEATNALKVIKEVRAKNAKAGIGPSGETIELFKSRVTGEYTTKKGVRKEGVKALAKAAKPVGSTTLNALTAFSLISPFVGAFGSVVQEQKRDEESKAAYPLHPPKKKSLLTRFSEMKKEDYYQALSHRFFPEEIYGDKGYSSLKRVKDFRRKGGVHWSDPI